MTTRDLDREQWHRQLLQRERELSVEEAVELAGGLYSTAPTSYLSCVARIPGFSRADLDRALYEDRTLVRIGTLRGSGFLIPIDRIDMVMSAGDRKEWYASAVDKIVGEKQRKAWTERVVRILDGNVLPAREIRARLGVSGKEAEALRYLLSSLSQQRLVAAAAGPTSWRDNQYGYALWDQWFPDHPAVQLDPEEARLELARWYLQGHGPGTIEDFSWWSGLKKANARKALEGVAQPHDGFYDLNPPADLPEPSGLRLLPIWDTALVTQKTRRRMVAEDLYPYVYDSSGNVTSTVMLDGEVIGVWDRGGDNERLEVKAAFFAGSGPRGLVEEEAGRIGGALGLAEVSVRQVDRYVDLTEASRNRFMSPLSGD